ncbi:MAG: insulinase family protein [Oligoflexia bacterium]|nr:insulinase family protein [Oligoflexia bacterium]
MKNLALSALALASLSATVANAMEVAFERDSSLPLIQLNVAVKAGSVTDPQGQLGLTNFMGEMLLRGTRLRTKEQIDLALDQMGAALSVETRAESMILRGSVLASQIDPFLKLVGEIVTQPSFPENEVRKLKSEVVSGILEELGNDSTLAGRRFNKHLFRGHPYGNPVLGTIKNVEQLNRELIQKHYDRIVRDKLLLIVGAGDTDLERIQRFGEELARLRPDSGASEGAMTSAARPENPSARRLVLIDKPDRTQTQIHAGQVGVRMTDREFFPLYLGNYAFGGGSFSARMMTEIRAKRGWSYGAYSYFKHGLQPRSWQFHLFPASKYTPEALGHTLQMVQDLKAKGITSEEFEFARRSLVNSSGFMYNTPKKRVENKLLERTLELPDGFMKSYGAELSKVSLESVNRALADFLRPEILTITVLGTASSLKAPLAKAAGVAEDKVEVVPYTEE